MVRVEARPEGLISVVGKRLNTTYQARPDKTYLVFSDGTCVQILFEEKCRLKVIQKGVSFISVQIAEGSYISDVLFMGEDVKWVVTSGTFVERENAAN